jgi:hypothetical protein
LDALSRKRTSDRCSERDVPDTKNQNNWFDRHARDMILCRHTHIPKHSRITSDMQLFWGMTILSMQIWKW